MRRDYILVTGMQGYGKSVWTRAYGKSKTRLLEFNPKADTPDVDYLSLPDDWLEDVISRRKTEFRYGTYFPEEIEMLWHAAYAAGDCTLINEECTMIFNRGEDIPEWARPMVFMGREPRLNLVLVTQRANSIPISIRSQASRIVTFLQTDPSDVKALSERIGREHADTILTLPELECLDWQAGRGVSRYRIHP